MVAPVFSVEYLAELLALPEVAVAKAKLAKGCKGQQQVYFNTPLTETLRSALLPLGLDVSTSNVPMRWIQGDTAPHVDSGPSAFENTYLVYLTDSPGEFVLGDTTHPITANTAFVFNEGIKHETRGTGTEPRLLLGPMNEFAQAVGIPAVNYYADYASALAQTGTFLGYGEYTIGSGIGGNSTDYSTWGASWSIASWTGTGSPPSGSYSTGFDLSTLGAFSYFLYPSAACFLEGTTVLCYRDGVEAYVPIETIKCGTSVLTPEGYKKVELIGKRTIRNRGDDERVQDRLYRCPMANYTQLTKDLYITGCHSILVARLSDKERRKTEEILRQVFITGKMFRLMACVDERAEPWASDGMYTVWHLALENKDVTKNYGIYVNGGLLVETCCIQRMKNKSNLTLC
jgi:hypothetical protein